MLRIWHRGIHTLINRFKNHCQALLHKLYSELRSVTHHFGFQFLNLKLYFRVNLLTFVDRKGGALQWAKDIDKIEIGFDTQTNTVYLQYCYAVINNFQCSQSQIRRTFRLINTCWHGVLICKHYSLFIEFSKSTSQKFCNARDIPKYECQDLISLLYNSKGGAKLAFD